MNPSPVAAAPRPALSPLLFLLLAFVPALWQHLQPALPQHRLVVRRGDTISYLAVRHYGFFNDSLLQVLVRANPRLSDLQRLSPGDTLLLPAPAAAPARTEHLQSAASQAVLTYHEGTVRYRRGRDMAAFALVRPNLILVPGDELETGAKGRAELVLDNRSVLRVDANSHLRILAMQREAGGYQAQFEFGLGSLWTRISKSLDRPSQVEVKLPTAIAGVQGTSFRTVVAADSAALLRVYDGSVEMRGSAPAAPAPGPPRQVGPPQQVPGPRQVTLETWVKLVRARQEIAIGKDGRPGEPRPFQDRGAEVAWVRWNQERDRDLESLR